jgi:glycosyltransferase involved in cell wall biosynthesis
MNPIEVSVIIPVFNEEKSIPILYSQIIEAMEKSNKVYEVIFVDDGSSDYSPRAIEEVAHSHSDVKGIYFRKNFGQTTAIAAGIDHSIGDIIVLMDADLQNDPRDIPEMLNYIDEGYDLVSGWRKHRKDNAFIRNFPSRIANWLISVVTKVKLHDYGCTLKAYRREVITGFRLYGEMHRFIPAYASSIGAKMIEIPVRHHPRKFGKTNYGLTRTIKVILDLITVKYLIAYSQKPIYLFGGIGLALTGGGFFTLLYLSFRRIVFEEHFIRSPLLLVSAMLVLMGFNAILMGLIAELLMRTYHEAQAKSTYKIRSTTNIDLKD